MNWYKVECRDTDGNDCTVIDFILEAPDADAALSRTMEECMRRCPEADEDGGWGAYYPCDCEIPEGTEPQDWWCQHGGFYLDENPEGPFSTYEDARAAVPFYHCLEVIED